MTLLAALRSAMKAQGVDAFLLTNNDQFQSEYAHPAERRLNALTGFTGSMGTAIVLAGTAAVFVDGRYTLQASLELSKDDYEIFNSVKHNPLVWLCGQLKAGQVIGYDGLLFTQNWLNAAQKLAGKHGLELKSLSTNPFDSIWKNRPVQAVNPFFAHDVEFAGEDSASKRTRIGKLLGEAGTKAYLISQTESIAWLLNLRGEDMPTDPLPLSRFLLKPDGQGILFTALPKITAEVLAHLGNEIEVRDLATLPDAIAQTDGLAGESDTLSCVLFSGSGRELTHMPDPCTVPRALKNPVQQAGIRAAHQRDGVALASVLAGIKAGDKESEIEQRLTAARAQQQHYRGLSFSAITGSGPNGAIVHYHVSDKTDRATQNGELLLVDSGGQYLDGTTDVTRTIAIGTPTPEMRDRFTRVLKGHIAIATAIFPAGTTGHQIDVLARAPLWQIGVDYGHGTGHGVGHYSSVHQVPPRIASTPFAQSVLQPGVLISNEPGYYKTGAYGIRIENLVMVQKADIAGAEQDMLCFETVTLCPFDPALIDKQLLNQSELDWLNAYHRQCFAALSPQADPQTRKWLEACCAPV